MKKLALSATVIFLVSCANLNSPTEHARLVARIDIMQPEVDVPHMPQPRKMTLVAEVPNHAPASNTLSLYKEGVHMAVKCDAQRVNCKHAAVLPVVYYNLTQVSNSTANLEGKFVVEVGRKITDTDENPVPHFTFTRAVSDGVEVIEEGKFTYPFSTVLKVGEPFSVSGRLGTQVTFTLGSPMK